MCVWTFQPHNGSKLYYSEVYNCFACVNSDHHVIFSTIRLSVRSNKKKDRTKFPLTFGIHIQMKMFILWYLKIELRFLSKYINQILPTPPSIFSSLHIMWKKRVPWESAKVAEKRENLKNYAQLKNLILHIETLKPIYSQVKRCVRVIIQSIPTGKNKLNQTQLRKQQSSIVWLTVNDITGRKKVHQAKIKTTAQQNCLDKWTRHFPKYFNYSPVVTHHVIQTIIHWQCDIKGMNLTWLNLKLNLKVKMNLTLLSP